MSFTLTQQYAEEMFKAAAQGSMGPFASLVDDDVRWRIDHEIPDNIKLTGVSVRSYRSPILVKTSF